MERLVRVVERDIPQLHSGIVAIRIKLDQTLHDVIVDYSDYPEYNTTLLGRVPLYFKMQCPSDGDDRLIPGGFTPRSERIYRYLRQLRRLRDRDEFAFDVYGRFGVARASRIRRQAVTMLASQASFRYEGGFRMLGYPSYLREIAKARICIDLPGNGSLCFRQMDCLAVGACMIGPRPPVALPVALTDRREIVYAQDDLSDLVELCEHYLVHDTAREQVAANARQYFDRYLHRDQLGAYYLHTALTRLG